MAALQRIAFKIGDNLSGIKSYAAKLMVMGINGMDYKTKVFKL